MDQGVAAIIGATIVGSITIITTGITRVDNNRRKRDELFFKALDFLDGGTQKRNLGIASLELSLKNKKHRSLCVSLLIGSAIYLITESKQKDAEHEKNNLSRIMRLLLMPTSISMAKKNKLLMENYKRLEQIIKEKIKKSSKGVERDHDPADTTKQIQDIYKAEEQLHKIVKDSKEPEGPKGLYVPDELKSWDDELNVKLN